MADSSVKNDVGRAYLGDVFMRHPLTTRNQEELGIAARWEAILTRQLKALTRARKGGGDPIAPIGFCLNKVRYGRFPEAEQTAHDRGWRAYMNVGVPLVEEIADIEQPPPDVISKRTYVNGTDPVTVTATDTVEFSISNTISWSFQGDVQLTFGANASASLQQELQKSMEEKASRTTTVLNSKDDQGVDTASQSESTGTTTATGTATGTGELSGQLMLGASASIGGSLTAEWNHVSSLSVEVSSRVDVLATVRRQVRQFEFEFPVTFGGYVALYYPEPVAVKETPPQAGDPQYSRVIAWKLGEFADNAGNFDMADPGRRFMQKGIAEVVAVRVGEHRVFQPEELDYANQKQPYYKS
ncbi:gluconolaconase [Streptomyces kaniharaensis]|uniref:Gluconolaconase n=1 Tax=Streptomyces kaniharaensis TaxID=212423 RepID=A0A6N7KHV0_9ACTN|nr:gluconolaconase [Streptomyces kaniharaensis]MQS11060.1 gluconolaconase [Streptomyces kaniharaensis]